jgi:prenylcysteine oxidase/farnesylcysteine lyase
MLTKWWQTAKVLWRYGLNAPRRANGLVASMLTSYERLYSPLSPVWDTIESLSGALGFKMHVAQSTDEYFIAQGVSAQFTHEMVEAATRVNYGHNVEDIHALEGACSMAADKASSVVGGNFQVFEHMIAASGARLALETEVCNVTPV